MLSCCHYQIVSGSSFGMHGASLSLIIAAEQLMPPLANSSQLIISSRLPGMSMISSLSVLWKKTSLPLARFEVAIDVISMRRKNFMESSGNMSGLQVSNQFNQPWFLVGHLILTPA